MSAHCNDCGADLVFGHGEDWQLMSCPVCTLRDELTALRVERDAAVKALRIISQWDCLNPPNPKLLADLPWLRGTVDEALAAAGSYTEGGTQGGGGKAAVSGEGKREYVLADECDRRIDCAFKEAERYRQLWLLADPNAAADEARALRVDRG